MAPTAYRFRVRVGDTGAWTYLPGHGAHIPGWNQRRRQNIVSSPLMDGGINTADRKWEVMTFDLVYDFYADTISDVLDDAVSALGTLKTKEGKLIQIVTYPGEVVVAGFQYEEVAEHDFAFTSYAGCHVGVLTAKLTCLTKPYESTMGAL